MEYKSTCPTVSIIVPVFNQEKYIGRCLRSLLGQSIDRKHYEIIVIDDGSNDRTPYALNLFYDKYKSPLRRLTNSENLGLPASLNIGIRAARGSYVVRVDSDDFVNEDFIRILKAYMDGNESCDAIACDYYIVDDEERVLSRVSCYESPIACGIMFKKQYLFDIGLYDEKFLVHEDRDLKLRFERRYKIDRLAIPLYRYRKHDSNITNNRANMIFFEKELQVKHGKYEF
jgi:glycosyltransferase involved in cell wall biosynthesis